MRAPLRAGLWLAAALGRASALAAQTTPPAAQPSQPTFRAGTDLVRVDVTVTTRRGQPATDLAPEDFFLLEDGIPQQIRTFQLLRRDGLRPPGDEGLEIRSPEHAAAEAARDEVRLFALFLDEYHVSRGRSTLVLRQALTEFVRHDLGETDLVALMDPLTPLSALAFTRDRYALVQAIQAFEGRRGIYTPPRSLLEEQQLSTRDPARLRMQVTLSALEALVARLGSLREGRKSVIFVSEGFALPPDLFEDLERVIDAANRGNTAVYTVDPRGLGLDSAGTQGLLASLAERTGGRPFVNTNDLAGPLRQVVRDASAVYLLGYVSSQAPTDGKFHEITVRVRRSGLDVRARTGYWAPSRRDLERAHAATVSDTPPEVTAALAALAAPRDERGRLATWVGVERGAPGRMRVTVSWELSAETAVEADAGSRPAGTPRPEALLVTVRATDVDGRELFRRPLPLADSPADGAPPAAPRTGHLAFDAPPGPITVSVSLESTGRLLDQALAHVVVADLWRAPCALATPRLFRAGSLAELNTLLADPDPTPTPRRSLSRQDRVIVAFTVYGPGGAHEASAWLLSRQGTPLAALPIAAATVRGATHQLELPLRNLAPGDYLVRVDGCGEDERAAAYLALRVRP